MPESLASLPPGHRGRILVVDDDRRMASWRAEWLCGLGWHAFAAGSAAEAARSPGRERAAACLIDAALPDGGGRRVAEAVRAATPTAAIVAVVPAGADQPDWADAAVAAPGEDNAVLRAIAAALRRRAVSAATWGAAGGGVARAPARGGALTPPRGAGYKHNAVAPIGLRTKLPIVISHRIAELSPAFLWLGGGHRDLKLGCSVQALAEATGAGWPT